MYTLWIKDKGFRHIASGYDYSSLEDCYIHVKKWIQEPDKLYISIDLDGKTIIPAKEFYKKYLKWCQDRYQKTGTPFVYVTISKKTNKIKSTHREVDDENNL